MRQLLLKTKAQVAVLSTVGRTLTASSSCSATLTKVARVAATRRHRFPRPRGERHYCSKLVRVPRERHVSTACGGHYGATRRSPNGRGLEVLASSSRLDVLDHAWEIEDKSV